MYFLCAYFTIKLRAATHQSLYVYHKMTLKHHKMFFPPCNEDCLQFVNLTLVKQIFCNPTRIAIMEKLNSHST
jgi:hypothetical protein